MMLTVVHILFPIFISDFTNNYNIHKNMVNTQHYSVAIVQKLKYM